MANDYKKIEDDHIVIVDMDEPHLKVSCCDCGLVHAWTFTLNAIMKNGVEKVILEIEIDRLERCTAQRRRHGQVDLIVDKTATWKMVRRKGKTRKRR